MGAHAAVLFFLRKIAPPTPLRGVAAKGENLVLAVGLCQDGIEHLRDEALLRFGQLGDGFDLLLPLWRRSALGVLAVLCMADQFIDSDGKQRCHLRQGRGRHADAGHFVVGQRLLCHAQFCRQFLLGPAAIFP